MRGTSAARCRSNASAASTVSPKISTSEWGIVPVGASPASRAPAGVDHPNTGHHHLLIDVDQLPAFDAPLPATDQIRHFGAGQTEAELTLSPGTHTLQLVFADYLHTPHEAPVVSEKITVTVK